MPVLETDFAGDSLDLGTTPELAGPQPEKRRMEKRGPKAQWTIVAVDQSSPSLPTVNPSRPPGWNGNPLLSTFFFFWKLVVENWERIQKLSSQIPVRVNVVPGIRTAATRRAPNLTMFTLPRLIGTNTDYKRDMFSNHAPRLRTFCATEGYCKLDVAWMSNIRDLHLSGKLSNHEICEVLVHLSSLESLKLGSHKILSDYQPPAIHLPSLRTLVLCDCLNYLRAIVYPPECSFVL